MKCLCGCGLETTYAKKSKPSKGIRVGDPNRYLPGHHNSGVTNPNWKGVFHVAPTGRGYIRARDQEKVYWARIVMEHQLFLRTGTYRPLRTNEIVHHVDENKGNDAPDNLALEQGHRSHLLKHHIYTDQELISHMRAVVNTLGQTPTAQQYRDLKVVPSFNAYRRHFGTWIKAIKACGLTKTYKPKANQHTVTNL